MNEMYLDPLSSSQLLSLEPGRPALTRREFVVSSVAAGFALAVQPVCAQTMIVTDTQGLIAGDVKIPTGDGEIPGYRAMPATGKNFPIILVVQEIFGLHEHIKDVCRRLAKIGYLAIAPDLFVRQGDVTQMKDNKEILAKVVSRVPDAQVMQDLDAAAAWAGKNGGNGDKLGITGFCWGGRIVWMYVAHNPKVKAGVAWYGPFVRNYHPGDKTVLEVVDRIDAPVLGLYGGADAGIPNDTVEKMREALRKLGKPSEIVLYPDTPHAFHADYRPSYRKEQAEDGWKRLQEWFRKHGVA
jgi:carboxymethylenebutenolidase